VKSRFLLIALTLFTSLGAARGQTVELIKMPLAEVEANADAGDVPAMTQLAIRHGSGNGVPVNYAKARELWQKAAAADSPTAKGFCAEWGIGMAKDPKLAFAHFDKGAATGDLIAIRKLGRCYLHGYGCTADPAKGFALFQKVADAGDPLGLYDLGYAYCDGLGTEKNPKKAVEVWEEALKSCPLPVLPLVDCYEQGLGCSKDQAHAIDLLTQGADAKNPQAIRELGGRYWNGTGVAKDVVKAHELWQRAGDLGDGQALFWLGSDYFDGTGVEKSFAKGEELWLLAGALDRPDALTTLADKYANGTGVKKDYGKANDYYQKGGDLGDSRGFRNLGVTYQIGLGVKKDFKRANALFLKAGELGDGWGFHELAIAYINGNGVPKDKTKGHMLFRKAAKLGLGRGWSSLGTSFENGDGVAVDLKQAVECYRKGGELGDGSGYLSLGSCYENGKGLDKDAKQANEFYEKAGKLGEARGYRFLALNYHNGVGVSKDRAKAAEFYRKAGEAGDGWSFYMLGLSYAIGDTGTKDPAKANDCYRRAGELGYGEAFTLLGEHLASGDGAIKDETKACDYFRQAGELGDAKGYYWLSLSHEYGRGVPKDSAKAKEYRDKADALNDADAKKALTQMRYKLEAETTSKSRLGSYWGLSNVNLRPLPIIIAVFVLMALISGIAICYRLYPPAPETRTTEVTIPLGVIPVFPPTCAMCGGPHEASSKAKPGVQMVCKKCRWPYAVQGFRQIAMIFLGAGGAFWFATELGLPKGYAIISCFIGLIPFGIISSLWPRQFSMWGGPLGATYTFTCATYAEEFRRLNTTPATGTIDSDSALPQIPEAALNVARWLAIFSLAMLAVSFFDSILKQPSLVVAWVSGFWALSEENWLTRFRYRWSHFATGLFVFAGGLWLCGPWIDLATKFGNHFVFGNSGATFLWMLLSGSLAVIAGLLILLHPQIAAYRRSLVWSQPLLDKALCIRFGIATILIWAVLGLGALESDVYGFSLILGFLLAIVVTPFFVFHSRFWHWVLGVCCGLTSLGILIAGIFSWPDVFDWRPMFAIIATGVVTYLLLIDSKVRAYRAALPVILATQWWKSNT